MLKKLCDKKKVHGGWDKVSNTKNHISHTFCYVHLYSMTYLPSMSNFDYI